jgi:hypothetical protein
VVRPSLYLCNASFSLSAGLEDIHLIGHSPLKTQETGRDLSPPHDDGACYCRRRRCCWTATSSAALEPRTGAGGGQIAQWGGHLPGQSVSQSVTSAWPVSLGDGMWFVLKGKERNPLHPLQKKRFTPTSKRRDQSPPHYRPTRQQDPAFGGSLAALLFLADIFWTGLVIPRPPRTTEGGGGAGKEDEAAGGGGGKDLIVPQDHAKSARLWAEAGGARFGDKGAQYNYAQCLLHGHGVPGACVFFFLGGGGGGGGGRVFFLFFEGKVRWSITFHLPTPHPTRRHTPTYTHAIAHPTHMPMPMRNASQRTCSRRSGS